MTKIIDCKNLSQNLLDDLSQKILKYKNNNKNINLSIIQIGNDKSSQIYRKAKEKLCEKLGIYTNEFIFESREKEETIIETIHKLNTDKNVNAIFLELPLPKEYDAKKIINAIDYKKDIDCLTDINIGKVMSGEYLIAGCTPSAVVEILNTVCDDFSGKNVVVMGRSLEVGKQVALLLLNKNATITITHSKTKNINEITKNADILIASIGKPKLIDDTYIKEGATVIDVGINSIIENDKQILVGDCDIEKMLGKAQYITQVPGGVGVMTNAMLIKNLVKLVKMYG